MRHRRSLVWLVFALFAVVGCGWAQGAAGGPALVDEKSETEMLALINQVRAANNLPALTFDTRLRETARFHSTFVQGAGKVGYEFAGEPKIHARMGMMNVLEDEAAENVSIATDLKAAQEHLLANDTTKANLLSSRYNSVGVGVLRQGDQLYIVQDFVRLLDEQAAPEVERQVAAALNDGRHGRKVTPLTYVDMPSLRKVSCDMAAKNSVNPNGAPVILNANVDVHGSNTGGVAASEGMGNYTVTFTTLHPSEPPDLVMKNGYEPRYNVVSVGACFQRSDSYPQGTYWVTLLMYHRQNFR